MPKKTIITHYQNNKITLENTWFHGAKLFFNDKLIAANNDFLALDKNKPIMSEKVNINGIDKTIEAFAYATLTVKLQIRVNGEIIGGELFE
jgi:hypothetical protein